MQCAGFVLTDENDEVLAVSVDGSGDLVKSHVKGYVRKDGAVVKEHDDKRQKAFDHPHVVGHAQNLQGGGADKAHSFDFDGKTYAASGKSGTSTHDNTPVRHFQEQTKDGEDSGRHLWLDGKSRVHADSKDEVDELRAGNQQEDKSGGESGKKSKPIKPPSGTFTYEKQGDGSWQRSDGVTLPEGDRGWLGLEAVAGNAIPKEIYAKIKERVKSGALEWLKKKGYKPDEYISAIYPPGEHTPGSTREVEGKFHELKDGKWQPKQMPNHIADLVAKLSTTLSADGVAHDKIKAAVDGILAIQNHIPAPKK